MGRPRPSARLALAFAFVLAACVPMPAYAAGFTRDQTPLPADVTGQTTTGKAVHAAASTSSTGGSAVRMLFGLAIVLGVIFALYWILKRSARRNDKSVKALGNMTVVATTPLAPSRALHLVKVGSELVLVGTSEQGVTKIRVYDADETRRLGFDDNGLPIPAFVPSTLPGDRPTFGGAMLETLRKRTAR